MANMIDLDFEGQKFPAYLARPEGETRGAVIVIHEVWALNEHTKNIAERFAAEGYLALAPDLLSETDIAEHSAELQADLFNPEKRNEAQPKLRALMAPIQEPGFAEKTLGKLQVCFDYLFDKPEVGQKIAVNGYCFGGGYSYSLATHEPRLKAAVPFYGHAPEDLSELQNIACPILAFYGQNDEGLVKDLPELKQNMQSAGVNYQAKVYPDCGHAFFNDTNPYAYNEAAASDAWQETVQFLSQNLN
ncbi:MAG: dienelactone hydrolase family protein [Candidatus Saccharimonadales bacterium]